MIMPYLLDANVFIQAKNLHYGFDFCPAFWNWLEEKNASGDAASVERVQGELLAGEDALAEWAAARGDSFFLPPDGQTVPALQKVSVWANSQNYSPAAVATFLQAADYWLIAYAVAHGYAVVTHEIPADSIYKIKIPNVCIGLNLRCVNPYEMLRRERARFVLGPQA